MFDRQRLDDAHVKANQKLDWRIFFFPGRAGISFTDSPVKLGHFLLGSVAPLARLGEITAFLPTVSIQALNPRASASEDAVYFPSFFSPLIHLFI